VCIGKFSQIIANLDRDAINDIQIHLELTTDNDHGSGDHWVLMAVLDKYGIRANSPTEAMWIAEEVIVEWYKK